MVLIYIIAFLAFLVFIGYLNAQIPLFTGRLGENFVTKKLRKLDDNKYKILADVLLPSSGNSNFAQIDHIVVSIYGVFCIETKTYNGWVFGNAHQKYWTLVIYRKKIKFYNPLWQNYAHTKAIEKLLGPALLKEPVVSFVAFPKSSKIKVSATDSVGRARDIIHKIQSYNRAVYSSNECEEIYTLLNTANITDKETRKHHKLEVRALQDAKSNRDGFGLVGAVIILFVILVIMVIGWFVYGQRHKNVLHSVNSSATHLTITRTNPLHQSGVSNFTKMVSDPSALIILHDINSLKSVPNKAVYNCPSGDGVDYVFKFTNPILEASAEARGCERLTVSHRAYFSTPKLWHDISKATGQPIDPNTSLQ